MVGLKWRTWWFTVTHLRSLSNTEHQCFNRSGFKMHEYFMQMRFKQEGDLVLGPSAFMEVITVRFFLSLIEVSVFCFVPPFHLQHRASWGCPGTSQPHRRRCSGCQWGRPAETQSCCQTGLNKWERKHQQSEGRKVSSPEIEQNNISISCEFWQLNNNCDDPISAAVVFCRFEPQVTTLHVLQQ